MQIDHSGGEPNRTCGTPILYTCTSLKGEPCSAITMAANSDSEAAAD